VWLVVQRKARAMEDEDERARIEAIKRRSGILPKVVDKNGIAEKESADACATIESCVEILKLRIGVARPVADLKDDAYWQSHWALYGDEELLNNLIGAAMHLGAYRLDTPSRQALDLSRVSSLQGRMRGKASAKAHAERVAKEWQNAAVDMANAIRAKYPALSIAKIATKVEAQWADEFPVGYPRLYQVLRRRNKGGTFEKK
jgi:hypothetical protein